MHGEFQKENVDPSQLGDLHNIFAPSVGKLIPQITVQGFEGECSVHRLADMFIVDKEI